MNSLTVRIVGKKPISEADASGSFIVKVKERLVIDKVGFNSKSLMLCAGRCEACGDHEVVQLPASRPCPRRRADEANKQLNGHFRTARDRAESRDGGFRQRLHRRQWGAQLPANGEHR